VFPQGVLSNAKIDVRGHKTQWWCGSCMELTIYATLESWPRADSMIGEGGNFPAWRRLKTQGFDSLPEI